MPTARSRRPRRTPVSARFPRLALSGDLRAQPKSVLREYAHWYTTNVDCCIRRLEEEVRASSPTFASWRADRSVSSFLRLETWLVRTCGIRMTKPEVVSVNTGKYVHRIEIDPMEVLQQRSIVPIFCLGVYFGAVLMKRHEQLRYRQYWKTPNFVMHGEMVLGPCRERDDEINPVGSMHLLALCIHDRDRIRRGRTLRAFLRLCDKGIRG